MRIELYRETRLEVDPDNPDVRARVPGDYRWRLVADNGEPLSRPGEGFPDKRDALHNLTLTTGGWLVDVNGSQAVTRRDRRGRLVRIPLFELQWEPDE